jgi:hypothetical protein
MGAGRDSSGPRRRQSIFGIFIDLQPSWRYCSKERKQVLGQIAVFSSNDLKAREKNHAKVLESVAASGLRIVRGAAGHGWGVGGRSAAEPAL